MAQVTSGVRAILSHPAVYEAFQRIMGAKRGREWVVRDFIRPFPGMRILDLGCGPAEILSSLPTDVTYTGYDMSPEYIAAAKAKFGDRGTFHCRLLEQAEVATPGNNEKRHLAGSLHWRTGRLLLSAPGRRRNAELFIAHLDDLRCRLRAYRVIHVVCDNARFHDCRAVRDFLAQHPGRIELHFLPKYAPETNPIERIWWHLHDTITRNHRCQSMDELLTEVYDWAETQPTFYFQTASFRTTYNLAA